MPSRELPARPNLEQLKKQAKSLLDAAQARDPDALRRFAVLPALSGKSLDEIAPADLALHDAQSAIAREHGFASWNALREEVESRTLSFDAAVDEFIRCATGGAAGRAERLLALHPRIAIGHAAHGAGPRRRRSGRGAAAKSSRARAAAGRPAELGAAALRVPHVHARGRAGARRGLVKIARRLCALGANPNAEYHWNWHPELPRTALWGAVCAVGTCRWRRCCSRPAPIRPTASRRTSPAAAAISMRSNCCTATA